MDSRAHERGRQVRARLLALTGAALLACGAAPAAGTAPSAPAPGAGVSSATPSAELTGNLLVLLSRRAMRARRGAARPGALRAIQAAAGAAGGIPAGRSVPAIGLVTVRPAGATTLAELAARLARLPGVAEVDFEHRYFPRSTPDDPALTEVDPREGVPYQWYLAAEGFPTAWDFTHAGRALVGVIDTGIDAGHPELASKLAAAVDQQGASDATGTARTDEVGHGTHVASLACAATGNRLGIAGAGYDCRLVVEKSDFTDSSIAAAIIDATDRGVLALNMSFGPGAPETTGPAPDSEVRALEYAAAHRVVLVAAAADSPGTEQGDPANVLQPAGTGPRLGQGIGLDVTAADDAGHRASFAGSGSEISLAAYGAFADQPSAGPLTISCQGTPTGLLGAYPANPTQLEQFPPTACRTSLDGDSRYAYLAGTSMAAPQVAATGAMLRALNPYATLPDILRTIKLTARRPPGSGWSSDLGWGILDAGAAVSAIRRVDRLPPLATLSAPRVSRTAMLRVRWSGQDQQRPGLIASGIAYYVVSVSDGGRPPTRLVRSSGHSLAFRGRPGHHYTFRLTAVDRAGNRSTAPARATTRVL